MKGYFLLLLFSCALVFSASAQETEADPYEDYSYLWEDTKAKKKEAKRKAKEEKKRQKELARLKKLGLLPDSLSTPQTVTLDSILSDSIPNDPVPVDSLQLDPVEIDSVENTEPDEKSLEPQVFEADSLSKEPNPEPVLEESKEPDTSQPAEYTIPKDTLPSENDPPETEIVTEETDDAGDEPEVKKEKKERKDLPPVKDFRSGLGASSGGGSINGGLTLTLIDDQYYAGLVLNPEFSIGKVGIGLNVPILYGLEDQSIRTEMFKDGVGAARLITHIRVGVQKEDPVYVKVGQLNNTMIGFGGLINNYTNTTSFEKRKLGLHYDFNVKGLVGIDGLYSDFSPESFNLFAIRPYVRPMSWSAIPIVRTFELGTTIVRDKDQTRLGENGSAYQFTQEGIGAFGIDAGVTLLSILFLQIDLFANYSKLDVGSDALLDSLEATYTMNNEPEAMADGFQQGSGASVGLNFRFHFIADVFSTDARIERLSYSEHYLPQFFDATYEINKDAKIFALGAAESMSGIYGSLTGQILKKVELGGSLMLPDNLGEESPAVVRLHADMHRLGDKFSFHGSYIKGNLSDLSDAFTFDERSLAKLRLIYHLNKFLATGVDYYWAFTPVGNGEYKATKYVSPYFGVSIAF